MPVTVEPNAGAPDATLYAVWNPPLRVMCDQLDRGTRIGETHQCFGDAPIAKMRDGDPNALVVALRKKLRKNRALPSREEINAHSVAFWIRICLGRITLENTVS